MAPETGTEMAREKETKLELFTRLCAERDRTVPESLEEAVVGRKLLEAVFDVSD